MKYNKLYKMIIYVLKLVDNKIYVGKTNNLKKRLEDHKNGIGSQWTKKYPYIGILETIYSTDSFDEDKYVKIYMNKFGLDNVRGGSYNTINLSEEEKKILNKELYTSNNCCYRCGRNNHFIKDCYAKTKLNGDLIDKIDKFINKKNNDNIKNLDNNINKEVKNDIKNLDNNIKNNIKKINKEVNEEVNKSSNYNVDSIISNIKSLYRYFKYN
jgi:hypothetical protein